MFAATADGKLLPAYVVYKSVHLYESWTTGGPPGTIYNRTKSGWFDSQTFEELFFKILLLYLNKQEGPKLLIGDNLSSHLNTNVIDACVANEIGFVFLPANSTNITQPLDVAFFHPLKLIWKNILYEWRKTPSGRRFAAIPKDMFPHLFKNCMSTVSENAAANIKSGFRKTGIFPCNRNEVLNTMPDDSVRERLQGDDIDRTLLQLLMDMRGNDRNEAQAPKIRKRINVLPGESVTNQEDTGESTSEDDISVSSFIDESSESSTSASEESFLGVEKKDFSKTIPLPGTFLLAKVFNENNTSFKYFVGAFLYKEETDLKISFLKEKESPLYNCFVYPDVDDISLVKPRDIVGVLETPKLLRRGVCQFNIDSRQWH